jgi:hypothetical protein
LRARKAERTRVALIDAAVELCLRRGYENTKAQGLADVNWDVIPFDWINDANTAATRYMLMTQIRPGSVVLLHDTYSSTVDLVYQFIPVLKANGYHLVTVTHLIGARMPGTSYGRRDNGPPANDLHDSPAEEIPALPPRRHRRRCRTFTSPTSRTKIRAASPTERDDTPATPKSSPVTTVQGSDVVITMGCAVRHLAAPAMLK